MRKGLMEYLDKQKYSMEMSDSACYFICDEGGKVIYQEDEADSLILFLFFNSNKYKK